MDKGLELTFLQTHTCDQKIYEKMQNITYQKNQNQNHHEISITYLTPVRMTITFKKIRNTGEDREKLESFCTLGDHVKWRNCYGKHQVFQQSIIGYEVRVSKSYYQSTATLLTIANVWE